ncbi:MAG: carboxypeptidase regulatory-like domain-containing protein [Mucilaginibacter sp.]
MTITGKVISQADTKPISHASVFLSNATIGTSTGDDGTFSLKNVMPGKYNLVVSMLGFDEAVTPLTVESRDIGLPVITLFAKTVSLNAVVVSAKRSDPQWSKNYDKFKTEFLGATESAKDCRIVNPEVLQIHYDEHKSILTATSSDFLEIENKALGYRIKYLLKAFLLDNSTPGMKALSYHGYTLFEQMNGTAEEQNEWKRRRAAAYEGSPMHFLRAVVNNDLEEEGFRVVRLSLNEDKLPDNTIYLDRKTYDALKQNVVEAVASGPNGQGIYKLLYNNDRLFISYNKYHRFSTSRNVRLKEAGNTLVEFTGPEALFDSNGALLDPQSIAYDGAWARAAGVANLLPVNYEDGGNKKVYSSIIIRELAKKLKTYTENKKAEKVYLHFDKPYYTINDTIYFKAYVTGGGNGQQLSDLSGLLNVELITPDNKINRAIKLKLDDGVAWGDFTLPDTLKSGNYQVRAYTNWMRNEGSGSFFEKIIPVGKSETAHISQNVSPDAKTKKTCNIQFMPEGGVLVTGNYSKIAFKAVAQDGRGTDVTGSVTDDTGNEVCKFMSSHLGMGAFNIVPVAGRTYTANVVFLDGSTQRVPMPASVSTGYTLTVNSNDADTLRLRVAAANGSVVDKLNLIAQAGGMVYYAAEIGSGNRFFSAVLPKSRFPSGIVQFTLFSASGEPLNERLVFIEQHNQAKFELTCDKKTYTTRQRVNIKLNDHNQSGKEFGGKYSVAVIDENKAPTDSLNETTILTSLLLTSDLKGNVEQPNYYFVSPSPKTRADMDNLLLTQGYRRFTWKQLADTTPPRYQPENSITISGTVKRNNKPVYNAKVKLFSNTRGVMMLDTTTDINGKFAFRGLVFADSAKFVVQSRVDKGQDDVILELDTVPAPPLDVKTKAVNDLLERADIAAYTAKAQQFYDEQKKYGINQHKVMLKEVKVTARRDEPKIPHSQNLNGPGNADHVLTAKDIERFICAKLSDCLQGVFGLRFTNGVPDVGAIIVDGAFVDGDVFSSLRPDDIEGIEILTMHSHYNAIYGTRMSRGGIIITTKPARRTDNIYYRYAPGVVTYMPKGFYKAREFYSPQYDNPHTNQKMADLRSTIYWNPNIITDKDGKASFSYFNADGKGTYRVVIEGIDSDGNPERRVLRYKVE